MVSRLPVYKEVAVTEKVDAYLERDGVHVSLQLCFGTTDTDEEDAHLPAVALDPGAVVEQPLPNDMRDVPADVARRATFTVPIAREDNIIDRRVTPGADAAIAAVAKVSAAVAAVQTVFPDAATMATIDRVVAVIKAVSGPSRAMLDAIAAVAAANVAFERSVHADAADLRQLATALDPRDAVFEPFSNL